VLLQEYLLCVTAYFHYFHSPILGRTEILGADIRYESDIDGLRRVPVAISLELGLEPTFTTESLAL
jgi:5-formaminoimidazole-4-carboxamide-1-(beta)-D-ribofuranosyl 5'-monophosphate synthetase